MGSAALTAHSTMPCSASQTRRGCCKAGPPPARLPLPAACMGQPPTPTKAPQTLVSERDILVPVSFHASEAFTPSWRTDCFTDCVVVSSVIVGNGREPPPPAGRSPAGTAWGPSRRENPGNDQIKCRTKCIVVPNTQRVGPLPGSPSGGPCPILRGRDRAWPPAALPARRMRGLASTQASNSGKGDAWSTFADVSSFRFQNALPVKFSPNRFQHPALLRRVRRQRQQQASLITDICST